MNEDFKNEVMTAAIGIVVAKNFALVNFGIAVGTILTYIGGKI